MIETLGTYAELPHPPREVERWLLQEDSPWRVTTNVQTGALTATLSGAQTPLGRVQVARNRDQESAAAYAMVAEGNALTLLHGYGAKAFTLRAEDVPAAVEAYRAAVEEALPLAPATLRGQRLVRVDASVTWRHDDGTAARALAQARQALSSQRSGRKVLSTHGVETVTLRHTKKTTVRCYDKSAEMAAAAKKNRVPLGDLGEGRLVRLEVQQRSSAARDLYGPDLESLSQQGALMARIAVNKASDSFGAQTTTENVAERVSALIQLGASPSEAVRLVGAAMLIAEGGIPALTSLGVTEPTAYRIRARLRDLHQEPYDEGDEYAESLFDIDDAEYAGDENPDE